MTCRIAIEVEATRLHADRQPAPARSAVDPGRVARVFAACVVIACCTAVGAVRAASNVVQYRYDAAGNLVAIDRVNPAPITLGALSPSTGPVGASVAIAGSGFSPAIAANAVAFNGVAAVVTAASVTSITVVVPAGATTGKVTVRVAGNTATSTQDFVVTTTGAPTITAFTPGSGVPGTTVAVSGTGFNPATGATTVKLNQNPATVSSVTATTLAFAVPAGTGSGRIRVTTGAGTAIGAGDFIVPPAGIAAADILATTRLAADGPAQGIALFATNKYGVPLFDGAAGAWMSLQVANFAVNPAEGTIAYTVYNPDNTQLANGTLPAGRLSIHLPSLPMAGTYSVLFATGLTQVAFDTKLETDAFLLADGPPLPATLIAGQSARAMIAAVVGEQALLVAGIATTPAGGFPHAP